MAGRYSTALWAGVLLVARGAHAAYLANPRPNEHQGLEAYLACKAADLKVEVQSWNHWTSKEQPASEIEKIIRSEVADYVVVTPDERRRLEKSNSLLAFSGRGTLKTPTGETVNWVQESSLLQVVFLGRIIDGVVVVLDLAPRKWLEAMRALDGDAPLAVSHWPLDLDRNKPKIYMLDDSRDVPVTVRAGPKVIWKGVVPKKQIMPNVHEAGVPSSCWDACVIQVSGGPYKMESKIQWAQGNAVILHFTKDRVVLRQTKEPVGFQ